jgi:hypothetical protein
MVPAVARTTNEIGLDDTSLGPGALHELRLGVGSMDYPTFTASSCRTQSHRSDMDFILRAAPRSIDFGR